MYGTPPTVSNRTRRVLFTPGADRAQRRPGSARTARARDAWRALSAAVRRLVAPRGLSVAPPSARAIMCPERLIARAEHVAGGGIERMLRGGRVRRLRRAPGTRDEHSRYALSTLRSGAVPLRV